MCSATERCNETVQVGNGQTEQASVTKQYPVFVIGIDRGSINQAVVKSNCPMLRSTAVVAEWDTDLWIGRNVLTFNNCVVTLPFAEDKFLVIDISDIGVSNLRKEWSRMQQWYKLSENVLWTLAINDGYTTG